MLIAREWDGEAGWWRVRGGELEEVVDGEEGEELELGPSGRALGVSFWNAGTRTRGKKTRRTRTPRTCGSPARGGSAQT